MKSEFEKHFLSLKFATEGSAQRCLDSCTFDSEQDAYLPDVNWISDNDADECVIYCCMLNTSYISFKDQQSKIDELQKRVDAAFRVLSQLNALDDEAWKRWKREACTFSQGESNAYEHSVRLLEQALKGGDQ